MVVVLVIAIAAWAGRMLRSRLTASPAEAKALTSYQSAKLDRELAEYALKEYREGVFAQRRVDQQARLIASRREIEKTIHRLKNSSFADDEARREAEQTLQETEGLLAESDKISDEIHWKSFNDDVKKARTDELAKQQRWKAERALRLWWGGGN